MGKQKIIEHGMLINKNASIIDKLRDMINSLNVTCNGYDEIKDEGYTNIGDVRFVKIEIEFVNGEKYEYKKGTEPSPYGYPYSYVPNIHHQYILILQFF